jgi:hypothetical protein
MHAHAAFGRVRSAERPLIPPTVCGNTLSPRDRVTDVSYCRRPGARRQGLETLPPEFLWWADPSRPWWAKLRRAKVHIGALSTAADDLNRSDAWVVEEEPGEEPDVLVYRLRVQRQPPPTY